MSFCPECGKSVAPNAKFCRTCGASLSEDTSPVPAPAAASSASTPIAPACSPHLSPDEKTSGNRDAASGISPAPADPASAPGGEEVLGVIANARKMKMLGMSYDTYNIVITNRRMILSRLTQAMLNAAIAEAQAKAKAEGKGFFGIMGDQMAAQFQYARRYVSMAPDVVLQETPGNSAIENAAVSAIDLRLLSDDTNAAYSEFAMTIKSSSDKVEYRIGEDDRFVTILKSAYGDRVHLPSGYFRAGGVKIKFF